jgi:hypothetical protein
MSMDKVSEMLRSKILLPVQFDDARQILQNIESLN